MNLPNIENFTEKFNRQSKLGFGNGLKKEEYDKISVSLLEFRLIEFTGNFIITFIINEDKNQSFLPKDDVKYLE